MKKIVSVLMALMLISGVSVARKLDKPTTSSGIGVMKVGSHIKLFYKGVKACNVRVTILDAYNQKVFSETIQKKESFYRPYNFSELPEGEYTIAVEDETGTKLEKVNNYENKVEKLVGIVKIANEEKYVLSVANKGSNEITIKIYDDFNNIVYNQHEQINGDFAKIYNLKNIEGHYTFQVIDRDGMSKTIQH